MQCPDPACQSTNVSKKVITYVTRSKPFLYGPLVVAGPSFLTYFMLVGWLLVLWDIMLICTTTIDASTDKPNLGLAIYGLALVVTIVLIWLSSRTYKKAAKFSITNYRCMICNYRWAIADLRGEKGSFLEEYCQQVLKFIGIRLRPNRVANCFLNLAGVALTERGAVDQAQDYYVKAQAIFQKKSNWPLLAMTYHGLGMVAFSRGDYQQAQDLFTQGLNIARRYNSWVNIALAQAGMARVLAYQGYTGPATAAVREAMVLFHKMENTSNILSCLDIMAGIAVVENQPVRAAHLFGATDRLRQEIGYPVAAVSQPLVERLIAAARNQMGATAFSQAWNEGRALGSLEETINVALAVPVEG